MRDVSRNVTNMGKYGAGFDGRFSVVMPDSIAIFFGFKMKSVDTAEQGSGVSPCGPVAEILSVSLILALGQCVLCGSSRCKTCHPLLEAGM